MIICTPTERQERYCELKLEAQQVAFDAIRPGARCCEVDQAVTAYDTRHNLMDHWRHGTGRALGMGIYEAPYFGAGDPPSIRPGMVFSVEPGIYLPGCAGLRHSDTVLVTNDGIERPTPCPRALEDLTVRV